MEEPKKDDLEYRVNQFVADAGWPAAKDIRIYKLVNDLWAEIKRLREERK